MGHGLVKMSQKWSKMPMPMPTMENMAMPSMPSMPTMPTMPSMSSSMANSGALGLAFTASVPVVGWREGGNPWRGGKEVIALMENGGAAMCW